VALPKSAAHRAAQMAGNVVAREAAKVATEVPGLWGMASVKLTEEIVETSAAAAPIAAGAGVATKAVGWAPTPPV